jgi:hypothetical protein
VTPEVRTALISVAERLRDEQVPYLLGGSALLHAHGLVDHVGDLDLMLPGNALERFRAATESWWVGVSTDAQLPFASAWKATLDVAGVQVEGIGDFAVVGPEGVLRIPYEQDGSWELDGLSIPLASLDAWRTIYRVIKPERMAVLPESGPAR